MSIESLVLVVFLLMLPLLERLVRALRERTGQTQQALPAGLPHPEPAPAAAPLPAPVPPPPRPRHPQAERVRASRVIQQAAAAPMRARQATPARRHPLSLSNRAELRRAVVLMAILGPCKAVEGETPVGSR